MRRPPAVPDLRKAHFAAKINKETRPTPSLHHSCMFLGKQQLMERCLTRSSQSDAERYLHRGSDQTSALLATSRQPPRSSCLTFANQYLILTWPGHQVLSREPGCPGKQMGFTSGSFLSGNPHIKYPVLTGKPSPKSYQFIPIQMRASTMS